MLTVDAVVFCLRESRLHVLLIERGHPPFQGMWALPGGFVEMDEPLEMAVARELAEETSVEGVRLTQFGAFGDVGRDPRGRVVTIGYLGVAAPGAHAPRGDDDAAAADWLAVADLPQLASDHGHVIAEAVRRLYHLLRLYGDDLELLPSGVSAMDLARALAEPPTHHE